MANTYTNGVFPPIKLPGGRTIEKPHPEWVAHNAKWRWLLDSYEGGDAYRFAVYDGVAQNVAGPLAMDWCRRFTVNLVPHKREWEDDACTRTGADYALRLMRTPVPTFVSEAVDKHLGKIFNQEIKREGPDALAAWWEDVDGSGSSMDHVMSSAIAPLLMVLGCLDIVVDRPPAPEGEEVKTRADEIRLGLDTCRLSYVLPQNTLWWRLDSVGNYAEILVRECGDDGDSFVYWDAREWRRYGDDGKAIEGPKGGDEHEYGCVPIFRAFDDPKRPRCRNVAMPRYESVAELQREYYNRDSELILSDTTQAHPLIQGPEDYVKGDGETPIGPNWLLPKKKNSSGTSVSYEGYDVIQFPKDGAESLRLNKSDIRDAADRAACLTKPAGGSAGTSGNSVGQSGVSKRIDQTEGNELLGEIAAVLQRLEQRAGVMALVVMGQEAARDSVKVEYPKKFDLFSLDEFMDFAERFQGVASTAGNLPETESLILTKAVRLGLPGLDDGDYKAIDAEIESYVKRRSQADDEGRAKDAEALLGRLAMNQTNQPAAASGDAPGDPQVDEEPA